MLWCHSVDSLPHQGKTTCLQQKESSSISTSILRSGFKIDPTEHEPSAELTTPKEIQAEGSWAHIYPDATEELDQKDPKPKGKELSTAVYFDSNFAHDEVTRRSITGLIGFIGNTPISWISKRQGAIATSTYLAEMCAGKMGTEEAMSIKYMLGSLGVPVNKPTTCAGDNLSMLTSMSQVGSPLKHKNVAVAYHFMRECQCAGIIQVRKIHTDFNPSDPSTKALEKGSFHGHYGYIYSNPVLRQ